MNAHQVLGSFSNTNLNIFRWLNWICKVDRRSRHNRNFDGSDRYSTILHITVAVGQNYWMVLFGPDKIWDTKVCCTQWIYKTSFDFCTYLLTYLLRMYRPPTERLKCSATRCHLLLLSILIRKAHGCRNVQTTIK